MILPGLEIANYRFRTGLYEMKLLLTLRSDKPRGICEPVAEIHRLDGFSTMLSTDLATEGNVVRSTDLGHRGEGTACCSYLSMDELNTVYANNLG